jgi:hypothetical protein
MSVDDIDSMREVGLKDDLPHDSRLTHPLPLNYLFETPTRRKLIDWVLDDADPDRKYYKSDVGEAIGIKRQTVADHIDVLVDFGLVEQHGERKPRYSPNADSPLLAGLRDLSELAYDEFTDES